MMQKQPLVSVITPVYNAAIFLEETIASVLHQTYTNWELLLVDDGSTDASLKIMQEFSQKDTRICVLTLPENQGAGVARNTATKQAKGSLIAFLDADDVWKPEKLETQIRCMQEKKCAVCYASYQLMREDSSLLPKIVQALPELSYKKLLRANYIGNLTGIYDTKKLGKIASPTLRKRQDWGLWLSVLKVSGNAIGIQEPLAYYRLQKSGISTNKPALVQYNYAVYRKVVGFSILKSIGYLGLFFIEQFFVKNRQIKGWK